jgi:hypothetical protein
VGTIRFIDVGSISVVGRSLYYGDVEALVRQAAAGAAGVLRADIARGVRDGASAVSFGWQFQ